MISVVIPLFNKAQYIARAIESVLAQTRPPREVIVVDDGSTDESAGVVKRYTDFGVRLIQQSNKGVSWARNTGAMAASGEYVAFLDADDEWKQNHLHVLADLIAEYPDAVLYSTSHWICRGNRVFIPRTSFKEGWRGYVSDFCAAYAKGLSMVNSSTVCISRSRLLAIGGFPLGVKRGEDVITWVRLAMMGSMAHAEIPTVIYHQDTVDRFSRPPEVIAPESLRFLSRLILDKTNNTLTASSVEKLFDSVALFTAAGFLLFGWRSGANDIARLAWQTGRYRVASLIAALSMVPAGMLRIAQKLRHRVVDTRAAG